MTAREAYDSINREAMELAGQISRSGSMLEKEKALQHIAHMEKIATKAGPSSLLAQAAKGFNSRLRKSYDGPANLGVALHGRFEGPGVKIGMIFPQSSAEKYGLNPGDIILEIEGQPIDGLNGLQTLLKKYKPGQQAELKIKRPTAPTPETLNLVFGRRM